MLSKCIKLAAPFYPHHHPALMEFTVSVSLQRERARERERVEAGGGMMELVGLLHKGLSMFMVRDAGGGMMVVVVVVGSGFASNSVVKFGVIAGLARGG